MCFKEKERECECVSAGACGAQKRASDPGAEVTGGVEPPDMDTGNQT